MRRLLLVQALLFSAAACDGQSTGCWGDQPVMAGALEGTIEPSPRDPFHADVWLVRDDGRSFFIAWPGGFTGETGRAPGFHHRIIPPPAEADVTFAEDGDHVRLVGGFHANGDTFVVCEADGPNGHWPRPGETAVHPTPG